MSKAQFLVLVILSVIVTIVLSTAALYYSWAAVDESNCEAYGDLTERTVRYDKQLGCVVKTETGWVPRSEIRRIYQQ